MWLNHNHSDQKHEWVTGINKLTPNFLQVATVTTAPLINISSSVPASANPLPAIAQQTSCGTNLQLCCYTGGYQCGVRLPPVIGAASPAAGQAPYGAYPWQAVLLGPGDVYAGSGALIDNLHVLTAAHKVTPYL